MNEPRFCSLIKPLLFATLAPLACIASDACPVREEKLCVPFGFGCTCVADKGSLQDVLNVRGVILKGDVAKLSRASSGLATEGTFPQCDAFARDMMARNDTAFVEHALGRGRILYLSAGQPVIIKADVATSTRRLR